MRRNRKKLIGIALGSGGARGWAHLGVLRALADHGIEPSLVCGTSMGALVGGVYAAGTLEVLHEFALEIDWKDALSHFIEINIPRSGMIEGDRIVAFVRKHIAQPDFSSLARPFQAVATELNSGREVVLTEGDVITAIRASISIPGIFTPVCIGNQWLIDGGLSNPVPISVAKAMGARKVIAVDVTALAAKPAAATQIKATADARQRQDAESATEGHPLLAHLKRFVREHSEDLMPESIRRWLDKSDGMNFFDVLGQSVRIIEAQISTARLNDDPPDILLQPNVGHLGFMDFHRAPEAINAGYRAAMEQMDAMADLL